MGDDLLPLGDIFTLLGDSRVPATLFSVDTPLDFGRLLESSLELRRLSQFTSKIKKLLKTTDKLSPGMGLGHHLVV